MIPDEKYRLLWGGGLPPWHHMDLLSYFENLGAVFVMETAYYPGTPFEPEATIDDPLEFLVNGWYHRATEMHNKARQECGHPQIQRILEFVREYQIDGIVMHGSRSCRATTIGQIFYKNVLLEQVTVPILFLESDIIDTRDYSEAQLKAQIDAFVETVAAAKEAPPR